MAEEERTQEQIVTPTEGIAEAVAPVTPSLEELQAKNAALGTEATTLKKQLAELDGHRRGQAAEITRLTRRLNDVESLRTEIRAVGEKVAALAEVSLIDEETETPLPPNKYQRFEARTKAPPAPTPQYTPQQIAASEELKALLEEAEIDPNRPPEDLAGVIKDVGELWAGPRPLRAVAALEKALTARKTAKEKEEMSRKEAEDRTERDKKASALQTNRSSSQGNSLSPTSWETLERKIKQSGSGSLSPAEKVAWKEQYNTRLREGKL